MKQVNNTLFAGLLALGFLSIQSCGNSSKNSTPTESEEKEVTEVVNDEAASTSDKDTKTTTGWTGASSVEELKEKLKGTSWHCNARGMMLKFHFEGNSVTKYQGMANHGEWSNEHTYSSYNVEVKRDTGGQNFVLVSFGTDDDAIEDRGFSIAFIDKCMNAALFQYGNTVAMLKYGDYQWSDDL